MIHQVFKEFTLFFKDGCILCSDLNGPDHLLCLTVPETPGFRTEETYMATPVSLDEIKELAHETAFDPPGGCHTGLREGQIISCRKDWQRWQEFKGFNSAIVFTGQRSNPVFNRPSCLCALKIG